MDTPAEPAVYKPLASTEAEDIERAIQAGTRLLTARELAPRIGLHGRYAHQRVMQRVRRGLIPACRMSPNELLFHWPSVLAHVADLDGQARMARKHPSNATRQRKQKATQ